MSRASSYGTATTSVVAKIQPFLKLPKYGEKKLQIKNKFLVKSEGFTCE
jgi:hypothetical protein